jgi:hypothetical protein
MRYYAIKIAAGESPANAGNTSGSAGSPVASNGTVANTVLAQLAASRNARQLGFRSAELLTVTAPGDDDVLGGSVTMSPNATQPWDTALNPDITHYNVDFSLPTPPASVQPVKTAPIGGSGIQQGSGSGGSGGGPQGAQFISVVNGQNDPGALDIEFNIETPVGDSGAPNSAWIKIRGIPFSMVTQSSKFNNCRLQMWAGYTNGLPLANLQVPHQGLILDGNIWPALGNWVYNDLSLEFFVTPGSPGGVGGPTNPKNIVHNVPANQPFSQAIKNTLQTAFPQANVIVNISDKIKLAYDDHGFYQSIEQYSTYLKSLSHDLLGNPQTTGYQGVRIHSQGNDITVKDDTQSSGGPIALQYTDFVGQPTWIGANKISIKCLLRGDISPTSGNTVDITLPANTLATVSSPDQAKIGQNNNVLAFQGSWTVTSVRHIGKFRSPSMDSWVTIIEAVTGGSGGGGTNTATDAPTGPTAEGGKLPFSQTGEGSGTGSST